jgi:hypothetical protein
MKPKGARLETYTRLPDCHESQAADWQNGILLRNSCSLST